MFIKELRLYVDYLCNEMKKCELGLSDSSAKYFSEFKDHLLEGIEYYQDLSNQVKEKYRVLFLEELSKIQNEVNGIILENAVQNDL